jgi:hypothetical protein
MHGEVMNQQPLQQEMLWRHTLRIFLLTCLLQGACLAVGAVCQLNAGQLRLRGAVQVRHATCRHGLVFGFFAMRSAVSHWVCFVGRLCQWFTLLAALISL